MAEWLESDPRIEKVTYAGLPSSPYYDRVERICPKGAGALFTFAVKGGHDACVKLIDSVELFSHVANLGDAKSLIIHPASTTHQQLDAAAMQAAGLTEDMVRFSVGVSITIAVHITKHDFPDITVKGRGPPVGKVPQPVVQPYPARLAVIIPDEGIQIAIPIEITQCNV